MATKKPKTGVSGATREPGGPTKVTTGARPAPFKVPKNPKPVKGPFMYSDRLNDTEGVSKPSWGGPKPKRAFDDGAGSGFKAQGDPLSSGNIKDGPGLWDGTMKPEPTPPPDAQGDLRDGLPGPDMPPGGAMNDRQKRQYAAQMASRTMDYGQFTALHGGKSTAALAGAFRKRFGGGPVTSQMQAAMEAAKRRRDDALGKRTGFVNFS